MHRCLNRLACVDRHVGSIIGADVVGLRADDLVIRDLLHHVGAPAGNAARGENAGEQLTGDSHVVLQAGRVEIDVAVLADRFGDALLDFDGNVEPLRITLFHTQSAGKLLEMLGSRVGCLVDRMSEAHELSLAGTDGFHPGLHILDAAELFERLEDFGIRPAVQLALQGTNGTGNGRVQIGQRGDDDT